MASQAQLEFAIKAKNEAEAALKQVSGQLDQVKDAAERGSSHLGALGGALGDVGKIAGGFVLGQGLLKAPGFLLDAAKAAAEDEAATGRLQKTLRTLTDETGKMGPTFAQASADVQKLIDKGQKLAFSDDEIRDSFGKLLDSTGNMTDATARLSAAQDLARARNIPLADATKLLGKLSDENVQIFKKMGITMADNATEADVLATIQAKFGGQAQEYAKSTAGQFAQAKIAMSEIVEGIGGAVLPILTKVGTVLAANLPRIQEFVGELGAKASSIVGPAMERLIGLTAKWVPILVDLARTTSERLLPPLERIAGAVGSALVATWNQNLVPGFMLARDAFRELAPLAEQVASWMAKLADAVADKLAGPFMAVFGFLSEHREDLKIFGIALAIAVPIVWALAAAHAAQATAATAAAAAEGLALLPILAIAVAVAALIAGVALLIRHWDDITAKYPALAAATDVVKAKFLEFTSWITGSFVPGVMKVYDATKDAIDKTIGYVRDHWDDIKAIIEPALKALAIIIDTQVQLWKTAIETVLGVIKGLVDVFMGVFTGDWDRAWGGVKQIVESVWNGIKSSIEIVIGAIKGLAPLIKDAGEALGKALFEGLKSALSSTAGFAGDVGEAVVNAVKSLINSQVIDRINSMLQISFDTHIPGVGTINIDPADIPHLASGGIVMKPTLALIGEAGPEAVVPLGKGGAMGGIHVHINAPVYGVDDLIRTIDRALKRANQPGLVAG